MIIFALLIVIGALTYHRFADDFDAVFAGCELASHEAKYLTWLGHDDGTLKFQNKEGSLVLLCMREKGYIFNPKNSNACFDKKTIQSFWIVRECYQKYSFIDRIKGI